MNKNQEKPNVLGIIAEYNPFHNGHLYHLKESKQKCSANYSVAIISGNFTQRGDTSIVNKFEKAKMAIENGVDMVIELPTLYSVSSAENFASGAIKILNELNFVTHVSFGSESGDINQLNKIANILLDEPEEYSSLLKEKLKEGSSFPVSRQEALTEYLNNNAINNENSSEYRNIINRPNNILAVEYLKSLKKTNSNIIPVTIKRENVDYYSENIVKYFASSTKIRHEIQKNLAMKNSIDNVDNRDISAYTNEMNKSLKSCMPIKSFEIINNNIENGNCITCLKYFEDMIFYRLRTMQTEQIKNLPDVGEGLENVIKKAANETNNLEDLIKKCKSKRYTRTRIQRILIYALLKITKHDMEISKTINPYIRVLGINENGRKLLSIINNDNIITSVKKFEKSNEDKFLKRILEIDKIATDIYSIKQKSEYRGGLDYTMPIFLN